MSLSFKQYQIHSICAERLWKKCFKYILITTDRFSISLHILHWNIERESNLLSSESLPTVANPSSEPPIWMANFQNSLFQMHYTYLWISNPRYHKHWKKKFATLTAPDTTSTENTSVKSKKKIKEEMKSRYNTSVTESPSFKWRRLQNIYLEHFQK